MSRFQAKTNAVLEAELEQLQHMLGLRPNQKADLLRELTAIAAWVIHQADEGHMVFARGKDTTREFTHPTLERIRCKGHALTPMYLSDEEATKLSEILNKDFEPPPALLKSLARIASKDRERPNVIWPDEV